MQYNLRSLQVLEVVARHRSVTKAAAELGVTPGAVSHQLRALSGEIGEQLVERTGRGIQLTPVGERLASGLDAVFRQIEQSVGESIGQSRQSLRLAVCSSFGPGWFIERLPDLRAEHPSLQITLRMYSDFPKLTDSVGDAFVTAYPMNNGYTSTPLFVEKLVAVCARDADARVLPLITTSIDTLSPAADWVNYRAQIGSSAPELKEDGLIQCSHYVFALEMAKHGIGVALVPDFLAKSALHANAVRMVFGGPAASGRQYYYCIKTARRDEAPLKMLASWFVKTLSGAQQSR